MRARLCPHSIMASRITSRITYPRSSVMNFRGSFSRSIVCVCEVSIRSYMSLSVITDCSHSTYVIVSVSVADFCTAQDDYVETTLNETRSEASTDREGHPRPGPD